MRTQRSMNMTVRVRPGVPEEWLREALAAEGQVIVGVKTYDHSTDRVFEFRARGPSRQFDIARAALASRAEVLTVLFD